jgi:hypothetical protein
MVPRGNEEELVMQWRTCMALKTVIAYLNHQFFVLLDFGSKEGTKENEHKKK